MPTPVLAEWNTTEWLALYGRVSKEAGIAPHGALVPAHAKTWDPAQAERLLRAAEAPQALAMLASYAAGVGLDDGEPNWTVSCLPTYASARSQRRAGTITVARDEFFYVWMDLESGRISSWGMYLGSTPEIPAALSLLPLGCRLATTNRGDFLEGNDFDSFLACAALSPVREAAQEAITAARATRSPRQARWHNEALAQLLGLELDSHRPIEAMESAINRAEWEVPVGYATRQVRQRLHQPGFRKLLMDSRAPSCAVCGLDIREVLDAAHIVADADGGPASSTNALVLCANHHRAMDRGLFAWVNGRAEWRSNVKPFGLQPFMADR